MEGASYEACSLAGNLGLSKLIVLYDSNNITMDGEVKNSFNEDIKNRFKSTYHTAQGTIFNIF